jgi:hypothetical protein
MPALNRKYGVCTIFRLIFMLRYTLQRKYRVFTLFLWKGQTAPLFRRPPVCLVSQRVPSEHAFTRERKKPNVRAARYTFV